MRANHGLDQSFRLVDVDGVLELDTHAVLGLRYEEPEILGIGFRMAISQLNSNMTGRMSEYHGGRRAAVKKAAVPAGVRSRAFLGRAVSKTPTAQA